MNRNETERCIPRHGQTCPISIDLGCYLSQLSSSSGRIVSISHANSCARVETIDPNCLPSQRKKQDPRAARRESMTSDDQPMSTCPFERPMVDIKRCTPDIVTRQGSEIENKRQNSHKFAVPSRSTMNEWWDVTSMRERLFLPTVKCIGWRIEWDKKSMAGRWNRPRSSILARQSGANHLNTRQEWSEVK